MHVPFTLYSSRGKAAEKALLDSGATENCLDLETAKRLKLGKQPLETPRPIFNVDGTRNKAGALTHFCDLMVVKDDMKVKQRFYLTHLGEDRAVFGMPWLKAFNPDIDWTNEVMAGGPVRLMTTQKPTWARTCHLIASGRRIAKEETLQQDDEVYVELRRTTIAQQMAEQYAPKEQEELPRQFKEFADVFSDEEAKKFPPRREDDHAIKFKDGTDATYKCRIYPMGRHQAQAIKEWTDDMLAKGFI
jgi:hypothetical protein